MNVHSHIEITDVMDYKSDLMYLCHNSKNYDTVGSNDRSTIRQSKKQENIPKFQK